WPGSGRPWKAAGVRADRSLRWCSDLPGGPRRFSSDWPEPPGTLAYARLRRGAGARVCSSNRRGPSFSALSIWSSFRPSVPGLGAFTTCRNDVGLTHATHFCALGVQGLRSVPDLFVETPKLLLF